MEDANIAFVPGEKIVRFSEHVSEHPPLVIANKSLQGEQRRKAEHSQQEEETSFSHFDERLV